MVERKAFLANAKNQYRVSQSGEHDCSTHNEKNGDYYECPGLTNGDYYKHPSLTHFINKH